MPDTPANMTAVLMTAHGGFEALSLRTDVPVPQPGPGEVLVRVGAAGVNNTDINTRIGWYSKTVAGDTEAASSGPASDADDGGWQRVPFSFPRIQGADVCGRIVAVGDGVDESRIGERILIEPCQRLESEAGFDDATYFGSERDGGFAQFCTTPARYAHAVESRLSDAELASFPCSYSTAENMITRAGITSGETVLVTGASGGVGSAAVQLARRRGARVIAKCGAAKAEAVKALGANIVIGRDDTVDTDSCDVVLDLVGGSDWPALLDALRRGGRYATSGAIAGPIVELDLRTLYLKDLTLLGCTALDRGVFASLVGYIERGEIVPALSATYPLSDIRRAQEDFLEKRHVGKLVLIPPQSE